MVFFRSLFTQITSTVIYSLSLHDALPISTSAMLRTCVVRFDAMKFTLSVRSFHTPATPRTSEHTSELQSLPHLRATRVPAKTNEHSWSTIVLMVFFSSRISPLTLTVIFLL